MTCNANEDTCENNVNKNVTLPSHNTSCSSTENFDGNTRLS